MTNDAIIDSEGNEHTIEQTLEIEEKGICPCCKGSLDTGLGFGKRDLECEDCDWNISYPATIYFEWIDRSL